MLKYTVSGAALAVALLAGAPAWAADKAEGGKAPAAAPALAADGQAAPQETPQAPVNEQDDVIVTGTRVTGLRASDSPTPVQVVGEDILKRVGQTDLMQALAQSLPSIQVQGYGSDQTAFHPSIKLRGLNPNHTLILIDGKRRHGTANVVVANAQWTGSAAPDLGLIPEDAIDHIEVLQDGAAAQYGTDAIAGVINIILKKKDHGGTINVTGGQYFDGGGASWDVMGNIGLAPIPDMYLDITAERKFHDYSFRGDVDPRVVDTGASGSANTGNSGGRTILARYPGVAGFANYPYVNRIFGDGQMNLTNAMYNMGYTGIPNVELYSFGTYSRRTGTTYQNYRLPNVIFGSNASPNAATPTGDIPYPTGFSPLEALRETDYAATGGAKGNIGDTTWDASVTYGRDFDGIYVLNSANAALYYDSSHTNTTTTNGVTTSTYTPGYSPRDVHDGDFVNQQLTANLDLTHKFDVGLSTPITLAGGFEYRHEKYELRPGEVASYYVSSNTAAPSGGIQSFFGYSPANASSNSRNNYSEYIDLSVKPFSTVFLEGSVRHENYSDFGDTTIFRGTARWDVTPTFAIRGTASTGFRAPTLAEEYYSGINVSVSSLSGIFAPNSPGAAALGISGLQPEKSTNFSAGVIFRPMPNLSLTVDAYSIYLRNRIVQSSGFTGYSNNCKYLPNGYQTNSTLASLTAAYTSFRAAGGVCTGFISPAVLLALYSNGVPITSVVNTINGGASGSLAINSFVNGINTLTHGIDFTATYSTDFGSFGHVNWSLFANYNDTKVNGVNAPPVNVNQSQGIFDVYAQSSLTDTTPKWRATAGAFWEHGIFSVNLRESVYGLSRQLAATPLDANVQYYYYSKTRFITDLELGLQATPGIKISIGANNLTNAYPNLYPAAIRAQQFQLSSTAYVSKYPSFSPIGIDGGYYYGRITAKF